MLKKTLKFQDGDTVAVALEALERGDRIAVNGSPADLAAAEAIPQGHKIALEDMAEDAPVVKYGHTVGFAARAIRRGEYVHVHNVKDTITDWRGNIRHEYDPAAVQEISNDFLLPCPPALTGYRRKDGSVGWRNYLLIVSTCACGNQPVDDLRVRLRDERDVVCVTNPSGCVILPNDKKEQYDMLLGLALNPNVGAGIFVGLGCEAVTAEELCARLGDRKPAECVVSQQYESCGSAADAIEARARALLADLRAQKRTAAAVSDIRLGVQCGASDWTTAAAANPAIGWCSDVVVKNGGISILGETCGWFGGEEALVRQARTREVSERILSLMSRVYDRCLFYGRRIEEANPAPGNIEGGITTLCEKALGNTLKGGAAPIEGVLAIGEQPAGPGFYVADNPGLGRGLRLCADDEFLQRHPVQHGAGLPGGHAHSPGDQAHRLAHRRRTLRRAHGRDPHGYRTGGQAHRRGRRPAVRQAAAGLRRRAEHRRGSRPSGICVPADDGSDVIQTRRQSI